MDTRIVQASLVVVALAGLAGCANCEGSKPSPPSSTDGGTSAVSSTTAPKAAGPAGNVFAPRLNAASCTLESYSSCTEYEGHSELRQRACRIGHGTYAMAAGCPREKVVAACQIGQGSDVDFFYEGGPQALTRDTRDALTTKCPPKTGTLVIAP